MRVVLIAASAAASLALSSVALAQSARIDVPGAHVRLGDRDHDYDRDHFRGRYMRGHVYGAGSCRTVTVRTRGPGGEFIVTKRRTCD